MTLDELVAQYGVDDDQAKVLKKKLDSDKVTIKNMMEQANITEHTSGGYTVRYIVSERTTLDEARMLEVLKHDWEKRYGNDVPCPYIKTVEVLDMDELEAVLYADELPKETLTLLDCCRSTTNVVSLKCGKAKSTKKIEADKTVE